MKFIFTLLSFLVIIGATSIHLESVHAIPDECTYDNRTERCCGRSLDCSQNSGVLNKWCETYTVPIGMGCAF
jgi:hypothetical protein